MKTLPAGMLPTDANIEIFADPHNVGKCYFVQNGQIGPFDHLPYNVLYELKEEFEADTIAKATLVKMGYCDGPEMLERYNYCNRGALDEIPDVNKNGKLTKEFFDCGSRGRCMGEGKVCAPISIGGERISFREFQCMLLIGHGFSYKQIQSNMGFKKVTAVNSLTDRLRDKLHCSSNTEIAIKVKELGIA